MRRLFFSVIVVGLIGAVVVAGLDSGPDQAALAQGLAALAPIQQRLVSGVARQALEQPSAAKAERRAAPLQTTSITGCPVNRGTNIRVNQDCLNLSDPDLQGRGQAQNETAIAQDPNNPAHLVASANDYQIGDGGCGVYYSTDDGHTWKSSPIPFNFTRGTAFGGAERQYWDTGGDPSVAWDTHGNAYQSCLLFNRGPDVTQNPDESSGFYLYRSTGTNGASWNFPGRPAFEFNDPTGQGVTVPDKPYIAIDDNKGGRYQDRIYMTWTLFAADGTGYIYEAYSRDHGESFSTPRLVSKTSKLCSNSLGIPTPKGTCNENQFSEPVVAPNGNLYVVFDNYNLTGVRPAENDKAQSKAATDNRSQVLIAKSTDGGSSFSSPVKVADYYDLPDCETYQQADEGVACVPEKASTHNSTFRAANYPAAAINPKNPNEIDVTFASYINRHSNERNGCVPQGYNPDTFQPLYTGVKKKGACNNDVLLSRSTDGGKTFTGQTTNVRVLPSVRGNDPHADQFWQWAAFDHSNNLAVSYYDRAYGTDEKTGFSDISLTGSANRRNFATRRVTTASMPPESQFEGEFVGDYSGLSAGDNAHPVWTDTRDPDLFVCRDSAGNVTQPPSRCTASAPNANPANDQNIYTRDLGIPTP